VIFTVYQAVKDVSASYDALGDLLESIEHFLKRLNIYMRVPPSPAMNEIIVKIMVELLSTLTLVTKEIRRGKWRESVPAARQSLVAQSCLVRTMKFGMKLFGEKDVEAVLQRLDRLTQDEARTAAAQTLEVVYGLVGVMKAVLGSEQILLRSSLKIQCLSLR